MDNLELKKNLVDILSKVDSLKDFEFGINGNPNDVIKFRKIIESCQTDSTEWVNFKFGTEIFNEDGSVTYHDCEIERVDNDG